MGDRQWFVLYVLVCLEVGIFLILVPWSAVWERNYFLDAYPSLRPFLLDPAVRGAVAGLGLANIYVGLSELFHRWIRRSSDDDSRGSRSDVRFSVGSNRPTTATFDSNTESESSKVDGKFFSTDK